MSYAATYKTTWPEGYFWGPKEVGGTLARVSYLIATALVPLFVFFIESNFREVDGETFNFDFQVALRLGLVACCGAFGLFHIRRTFFHLERFPAAWSFLLIIWAAMTLPIAVKTDHAFAATFALFGITLFAPAALLQLGPARFLSLFCLGLLVFLVGCWVTWYVFPDLGRTSYNLFPQDYMGRERFAGLAPANGTGRQAALCTTLLLVLGCEKVWKWRYVIPSSMLSVYTLYATDSRTAMLSAIAAATLIGLRMLGTRPLILAFLMFGFIGSIGVFVREAGIVPVTADSVLSNVARTKDAEELYSLTGRLGLWEFTWSKIKASPVYGYGYGCARFVMPESGMVWGNFQAHNLLLNITLCLGLVGGGIVVLTMISQFYGMAFRRNLLPDALVVLVIVGGVGDMMMFSPIPDSHTLLWLTALYWRQTNAKLSNNPKTHWLGGITA